MRSPGPTAPVASTMATTTSTSSSDDVADSFMRWPSAVRGRCSPGVSTKTTWASGRLSTPRTWDRVVFGRGEVMVTLAPTMALTSVDFPTLGRPTTATNPDRKVVTTGPPAAASGTIRTRSIRRPVTRSATSRSPSTSTDSPATGTCPRRSKTRPPTVSQAPSGRLASASSLTSSTGRRALTRSSPESSRSTGGSSTSNSSTISPTSSSMRSSRVTSPAMPPYSSTTTAWWNLSACISRIRSDTRLVSGTKWAARRWARTGVGALALSHRPDHVLRVGDADHIVDLLIDGRHPAVADLQRPLQDGLDRLVGIDGHHVGAGHHHLPYHGVAELDDGVDQCPLLGLDDLLLQGHVGHGQQLGLGHVGSQVLPLLPDEQVGQTDEGPRQHPHRPEADDGRHQGGAEQGGPLRMVHGPVLRHRLAQHEDHHDLEHGGGHHTPGPEPVGGQDPDQGGHHQLADEHQQEHRVEEALGVLGQAEQDPGPPASVLDQAQRLGPAHADQAGLGQGQQGRDAQEQHHHHQQDAVADR